jgi:phosphate starvation-inducible PhoH-like protein
MRKRGKQVTLEDLQHWEHRRDADVEQRVKVQGKTRNHNKYLAAIDTSIVTICIGPAGTGKTWMACGKAAEALKSGKIDKIVLSRPLVECGESVGTLPGELDEKVGPFVQPMMDAFGDFLSPQEIYRLTSEGRLLIVPLAYMRGRTFKNAFVILDEAQNATFGQLRMFLTRLGVGSRLIINGDHTQSDFAGTNNPLERVVTMFQKRPGFRHQPISIVKMGREDIVRHSLIQWMDEALMEAPIEAQAWYYVNCPSCGKPFQYQDESAKDHALVECWQCHDIIELLDADGKLNPIAVCRTDVGDEKIGETRQ